MSKTKIDHIVKLMLSELSGISRASVNTIQAYTNDLETFIHFCEENKLADLTVITERHIRFFIMRLNELGLEKSSVSRKLSALRRLFNFAIRNDIIEVNPTAKISNPKVTRKLPETINLDSFAEIYNLIDEKEKDEVINVRNKAIFELLYGCALRVSELCGLNIGDVDLEKMSVRVLGKGSKVRIVPLGKKSLPVLSSYYKQVDSRSYSQPLFTDDENQRIDRHTIYRIVKKYLSVTEIKKKSPHILRHSAATHMLDNEADLMAVKEILGHENLSTTQIYTHVSVERLKKAYKQAHPKSKKGSL